LGRQAWGPWAFSAGISTNSCRWIGRAVALALFCAVCFIKDCLAHPPFVIFVYAFLRIFWPAHFLEPSHPCVFRLAELFAPKKLDQWPMGTLLASTCGTLFGAALLATVAIVRRVRQPPGVSAPSP
jgi:hypothetical protein